MINSNPKKPKKRKPKQEKEERLFQNLLRVLQQFMQGRAYKPMSAVELLRRLGLPEQHKELVQEALEAMVIEGEAELMKGSYHWADTNAGLVQGILRIHPRGFGFFQAEDLSKYPDEVFIPKHLTLNAVDGDTVQIEISSVVSEKGPEGKVIAIVSRGRTQVVGTIRVIDQHGEGEAYVPLLGSSHRVIVHTQKGEALREGDRAVLKVIEWGNKDRPTEVRVARILGHISDPSCDIPIAIAEYELREEFPKRVVEEAKVYGTRVATQEIKKREDLRDVECVTIDPDTAKDFDDALSVTKDKKGHIHLGVHIADVSHYVHPGSALDEEAFLRCNSTYFPGYCVPMLPPELSDNLCSLKPEVNRLAVSVLIEFDPTGSMMNYRIVRSVIRSAKRFSYREAKEVLDGKKGSPFLPLLNQLVELCRLLKRKRYERGSIEFSIPELIVKVDKAGVSTGTDYVEYDITHQMVEECMLKANETVALHLNKLGKNLTYRIHEEPTAENLQEFAFIAGAFGFNLPSKPEPAEIQRMFEEAMQTPFGPYLATSYIRSMRLAIYSPDNIGHFGLSLSHYCHFTSPIRRYVDLIAHRILFGESDDRTELEAISRCASERERISSRAESSVVLLKKMRLLQMYQKQDPQRQYAAVIARVKPFGVVFEVIELMVEGFIHISELGNDYYIFEEEKMQMRGRRSNRIYRSGEKITLMLKQVDLISCEAEWHQVAEPEDVGRSYKRRDKREPREREEQGQSRKSREPTFKFRKAQGPKRDRRKKEKSSGNKSKFKKEGLSKEDAFNLAGKSSLEQMITSPEKVLPSGTRKPFLPVRQPPAPSARTDSLKKPSKQMPQKRRKKES